MKFLLKYRYSLMDKIVCMLPRAPLTLQWNRPGVSMSTESRREHALQGTCVQHDTGLGGHLHCSLFEASRQQLWQSHTSPCFTSPARLVCVGDWTREEAAQLCPRSARQWFACVWSQFLSGQVPACHSSPLSKPSLHIQSLMCRVRLPKGGQRRRAHPCTARRGLCCVQLCCGRVNCFLSIIYCTHGWWCILSCSRRLDHHKGALQE